MAEARFCSECRAEIPRRQTTCPQCGLYAGDLFDGRLPRGRRSVGRWLLTFLMVLAATAAAGWLLLQRRAQPAALTSPPPIAVVSDRPGGSRRAAGANVNEAEAIRILRRHFVSSGLASDCIVLSSQGVDGSNYRLTAINRCDQTRLGRWIVDGRTGEARRQ